MAQFSKTDIEKIAAALGAEKNTHEVDHWNLLLVNAEDRRKLRLQIYPETALGKSRGALVVAYTHSSHLQLHNCSGYVISEDLGEVTFVAETADRIGGLVIEKSAFCSLYSGVNRDVISGDFTQLGPEVMLSGVALSLAEDVLGAGRDGKKS